MKCETTLCNSEATKKGCIFQDGISVITNNICDECYDNMKEIMETVDGVRVAEGIFKGGD